MALTPQRHIASDAALVDVFALIRESFAYMHGRIDPPSSVHLLDLCTLQDQATAHEVWSLGIPPQACAIFKAQGDALYIGKVAVDQARRRQGHAAQLIELAHARAKQLGLNWLTLECRVELTENHAAFQAMGFSEVGRTAHAGYTQPTSITVQRQVG